MFAIQRFERLKTLPISVVLIYCTYLHLKLITALLVSRNILLVIGFDWPIRAAKVLNVNKQIRTFDNGQSF